MRRIAKFVAIAVAAIAAFFVFGWFVKLLWNAVIPPVTGWHAVTYWQAVGLLVLSKILFAGFRGGCGSPRRRRMLERYSQMSPEEREKFREGMRSRCGGGWDASAS
jgi:hypothetical protein